MITRYTGDSFSGQRSAIGKYSSAVNKMADTRTAIAKLKIEQEEDENRRKIRLMLFQQLMKIGEHVGETLEQRQAMKKGLAKIGREEELPDLMKMLFGGFKPDRPIGDTGMTFRGAGWLGREEDPEKSDALIRSLTGQ